jgi:hypothetical protein
VIDGVTLAEENRVLVKDQAAPAENGMYKKNGAALVRTTDYAEDAFVKGGLKVYVQEGTANAKKTFRMFTTGTIDVGTTATSWEEDGGGGGGSDLATTLAAGNITDGTNLLLSSGDEIAGAPAVGASGLNGFPLVLRGGDGDGAGGVGPTQARTTGNARGKGAVDLQVAGTAAQVAAPDYSVLTGKGNTIGADDYAAFVAGHGNTSAFGSYGNTVLGKDNQGTGGTGGYANTIVGWKHRMNTLSYFSGNTVGGFYQRFYDDYTTNNTVGGWGHKFYDGGNGTSNNAVFGKYHRLNVNGNVGYTESNFMAGNLNQFYGPIQFAAVMGRNHVVAEGADYTFLAGGGHVTAAGVVAGSAVGKTASVHTDNAFFVGTAFGQASLSPSGATNSAAPTLVPEFSVASGRIVGFTLVVTAIDAANSDSAMWIITGAIANIAGTTALVGSPLVQAAAGTWSAVSSSIPTFNTGAAGWTIDIAADNVNDTLEITGGSATATTDWHATLTTSEAK